jgi:hypothetical protein
MNQDRVKEVLQLIRPAKVDFSVIFSGKKNSRINGLYMPATHEIIIHNGNFTSDNDLLFTALHEYAHHIHGTDKGGVRGARAHNNKFWAIFHELLTIAEKTEAYKNPTRQPAFASTTKNLQDLIAESGRIMREMGLALIEANKLCKQKGARFDDYVMRVLKQTMPWARACMAAALMDLPKDLGAENIKVIASIKNSDERGAVISGMRGNLSPQQIAVARASAREPQDVVSRLKQESERITKTIEHLLSRRAEIDRDLKDLEIKAQASGG